MSADTYRSSATLTGARQTMMSWARLIDSFNAVPDFYKFPYQKLVGNTEIIPYTVLAPAQGGVWYRKPTERLLCDIGDMFYVLERAGSRVNSTGFRYADICSLEVGNILLYSWFSIHGKTNTGNEAALTVEFNEATLRHFEPFFCKMRPLLTSSTQTDLKVEQAKFDCLSTENFKFMNFARESVAPGERVVQAIYQPGNRQRVISVLGRNFYRTIFPDHFTILTDKEIILIGDAENITEKKRSKYGGVRRYLPLSKLVSVAVEKQVNDLLELTFHVSQAIQVKKLFDASHMQEVEDLKKVLETLLGQN